MRLALITLAAVAIAAPAAAQDERAAIDAVLDDLHAAAARADGPAYWALYAPDAVFVGTDASERWTLAQFKAYADPHFNQGKGWSYTPRDRQVTFAAIECRCVAWFEETLDSASYGTTRGTGVLVKGEGGWKIGQYSLSIPVPNDIAEDLTAQIKAFEAAAPKP